MNGDGPVTPLPPKDKPTDAKEALVEDVARAIAAASDYDLAYGPCKKYAQAALTAMNAARTPITSGGSTSSCKRCGSPNTRRLPAGGGWFITCDPCGHAEPETSAALTAKPSTDAEIEAAMFAVNPNVSDATATYTRAVCRKLTAAKLKGEALVEALNDARKAIASLDDDAFGFVDVPPEADGETGYQYPIRDELLSKIDAALAEQRRG